jgi:uncharacterized protein YfdQ (DUF2303 family)
MENIISSDGLINTGKELAEIERRVTDILGVPHALVPQGYQLQTLEKAIEIADKRAERDKPRLLAGTATINDEASFVRHVNRFKDGDSVIFFDKTSFTAVYDYNRLLGANEPDRNVAARFGKHRASFAPELSDEWKAWVGNSGRLLGQEAFADFLDEHVWDIAGPTDDRKVPTPAALASLAYSLKVMAEDTVDSTINRTTGEYNIVAKSEQKTTGSTQIPPEFDIEIPIFTGCPKTRLTCKFRLRKSDGLTFGWVIPGAAKFQRQAMEELAMRVREAVDLPVLSGKPE